MNLSLCEADLTYLVSVAPPLALLELDSNSTIDDVASLLVEGGPRIFATLPFKIKDELIRGTNGNRQQSREPPPSSWWNLIKAEFHEFLCEKTETYRVLRERVESSGDITGAVLLSVIASAIGESLGFEAGAITSLVAVCVYGASKLGKEAYCKKYKATKNF